MSTPNNESRCVSIIFNPTSGKENPQKRQEAIAAILKEQGYSCRFLTTTKQRGAEKLAEQAIKDKVGLIFVSGGDGTIMEVLSALVGTDIPVAVLPAGTGNLLATNLGIPTALPEAVALALSRKRRSIDLARTGSGRYFAIMGGIGMDAQMIHDADRESKDRFGVAAYFISAWKNRLRHRVWVSIELDGKAAIRRKVKTVVIANMGKITGGLQAVPDADPANGSFEIGIVTVSTAWQWLRVLAYALIGKTHQDPKIEMHTARKVTVRCDRDEPVQFDGEDGGKIRELTVELVPRAIRIVA